ncbi:PP2C family protein-serine/threonine phosphatase [Microbacterium sp. ASV81]|uniref:Protein phosphatase 2C domain-containing protein n=1 Tax=Microbacterium capsulatum TaxID=3041921 RepID=A0ABU0XCC8_9MICO|nr:protein phosphatase 2C domain-containing protein [Microbacterium sp. ASV81]MDQ4212359.1 protein phosphatase 2C domain-containing protein [Microbacterium sp. ASV81]
MSQKSTAQTREVALASGDTVVLHWAGATDTGRRRESNQDSYLAEYPLFVVADGMGGHAGGEIASQRTVARLEEAVAAGEINAETIETALEAAVDDITAHPDTTDEGTGTTLTGVYLSLTADDARWVSLNIGDSRVYLLRDEALSQITTDHSVVQELITAGRLSPEEAEGHPYSNVITRAVGVSEALPPDYRELSVQDGDRFVICSDGLTKELTDYGIQHFLGLNPTPNGAVDAMMTAALENGGRDNVTIVVVDVRRRRDSSSTGAVPAA